MSNLEGSANHSRKSRIFATIFIVTLIIFATIVVIESSSLQWPLATYIGKVISASKISSNENSSLLVSATRLGPLNNMLRSPIFHADVTIKTSESNPTVVATNYTNTQGKIYFVLRPNVYQVIFTSNVANLTIPIITASGNTTEIDINVNQSVYSCTYFNISSPPSPVLITPWDTIFLTVQSGSSISQNTNETVFLQFLPSSDQGTVIFSNGFPKIGVTVLGGYHSGVDATQWLKIRVNSITPFNSKYVVDLLTYFSSYTITQYPTQTINGTVN